MALIDFIPDRFKKKEESLPEKDVAWSESSSIYSMSDFEKYNPDDLISRKGFGIYKKMMIDEQVKAVVKFKRDAVTSREFLFSLDHEKYGLSEEEAKKRISLSYEIVDQLKGSWMDGLNGIMSAMYNGFSMTEKVFGQIEYDGVTWWGIDRLKLKPFDTFFFKTDDYGNVEDTIQKIAGKEQKVELNKFIKFIVNPDTDEHYGGSELREAYRAWFSKDVIIKFRNMYLERHAGGFRYIQAKEGKTIVAGSADYVAMQNALNSIQTSTGMILPNNVDIVSEYPANNVAYKEAIDDYDTAIARALLVPNLLGVSPQGNTGSFAQSTNQLEAFLWTLEADANRLEEAINEQLFRQLAKVNFGDDAWPRFKFKPASGSKKLELLSTWKDLVSAGAVQHTESDESHIRDLLEFPEGTEVIKDEQPGQEGSNVDDSTNSGDTDTGAIDEEEKKDKEKGDDKKPLEEEEDKALSVDSTIIGKGLVSVTAFSSAVRRCDFAVIAKTSDSITDDFTAETAKTMDFIIEDLIVKAKEGGPLTDDVSDNIKRLKVDKQLNRKLNNIQKAMLKEGYSSGVKHASLEIDKAMKTSFSIHHDQERLKFIADDYFKVKAFKITGNFTDAAVSTIEAAILNGAKYDKAWYEVEQDIYRTFATKGMISTEQAKEALGEALGVASPDARIRTVIRTSTFDAINEARHSYFTDPALDGYVVAYEYSAILDDRTTQICNHLDAENRGDHSVAWYGNHAEFRPPNHYNCRSLLIPVTEDDVDSFVEGAEPTMTPQEGFK